MPSKVVKSKAVKSNSDTFEVYLGTFIDNAFTWYSVAKYKDLKSAYKGFKNYVNTQLKYTDEELQRVWDTGRLDIELRQGNKLLNWVGIYSRKVASLDKKEEKEVEKGKVKKEGKESDKDEKKDSAKKKKKDSAPEEIKDVIPAGDPRLEAVRSATLIFDPDSEINLHSASDELLSYINSLCDELDNGTCKQDKTGMLYEIGQFEDYDVSVVFSQEIDPEHIVAYVSARTDYEEDPYEEF